MVIGNDVRDWLLIGDETALPAIGRRIEEAGADERIMSVVAVVDVHEQQRFETRADLTARWAHRPVSGSESAAALLTVVDTINMRPGTFVWIAAEAGVARRIRDHLADTRGHPRSWIKAAGYWLTGKADTHGSIG